MSDEVARAVEAIRAGGLAVIPTDTVYGLACTAHSEAPYLALAELKGREAGRPTALVAASVGVLLDCLPELQGGPAAVVQALLPGPYTLVLPNPARRFSWLGGGNPDAIGVRVPAVTGPGREVLDGVGAVAATSANLPGGPDPRRVEDVPAAFRAAAVVVDGGDLPGTPSTVIDLAADEPRILRAGAADPAEALRRVAAALQGARG